MKGKIFFTLTMGFIAIVLISELIELLVYFLSDTSSLFEAIENSFFTKFNRIVSIIALPIFAIGILVGVDRIDVDDRRRLIYSIVFYVVVRIILLMIIFPYNYDNVYVSRYFTTSFFVHLILASASLALLLATLYYVLSYKLNSNIHWLVFYSMIVLDQVMTLIYQVLLVYLFHRNTPIESEFYKIAMLAPVFLIQLISVISSFAVREYREKILDLYGI